MIDKRPALSKGDQQGTFVRLPLGLRLRDLIEGIGGGGMNGDFHAVVLVPASQAEIAAANALPSTSQSHFNLPSKSVIQDQSMLDTPRNGMLARFLRLRRRP